MNRNADLSTLAEILRTEHARKIDLVVPASKLRSSGGELVIEGADPIVDADGVTDPTGSYEMTSIFDEHVSEKLGVPLAYVRRMRADRIDLFDANVNGWLRGGAWQEDVLADHGVAGLGSAFPCESSDHRSFLIRLFRGDDSGRGVARAMLSNGYRIVDNLDVLTAALDGIRESGVPVNVEGCDLTDRRMYVRIAAPSVAALAPTLLAGYRSPFTGASGTDNPTVFAGFEISNSEVGGGAFTITPRLVVEVCRNGMKVTKDALRSIHLGSKLNDGVIRWTDDTQRKNLDLVAAQARDAVATFLDVDYVSQAIQKIEADAKHEIDDAANTIEYVGKTLRFGEEKTASVLDHFIRGGQMTAGGVLNAVTSVAQTLPDADAAAEFEAQGLDALALAAR